MEAKRVLPGLTLVTVGAILLANTTGALPWSVWWSILLLWPLLIVSLGIDILGRAVGSTALRALAGLVVVGGLVYGALAGSGRVPGPPFAAAPVRGETFSSSAPLERTTSGRAHVSAGLARVTLDAGEDLASARGETPFGRPGFAVERESPGTADVSVCSGGEGTTFALPGKRRSFLDVRLSRRVTWERVEVDAGVSDVGLDLRDIEVAELVANTGLSSTEITFGERARDARATLTGGMASYKLRVPASLGVELRAENGLGGIDVPSGWTRTAGSGPFQGTWRSEGYDLSRSKLLVTVKAGLSGIEVERY